MRFWVIWACPLILFRAFGEGADRFSFQNTSDFSQGIMSPSDWGQVACEDPDTCVRDISCKMIFAIFVSNLFGSLLIAWLAVTVAFTVTIHSRQHYKYMLRLQRQNSRWMSVSQTIANRLVAQHYGISRLQGSSSDAFPKRQLQVRRHALRDFTARPTRQSTRHAMLFPTKHWFFIWIPWSLDAGLHRHRRAEFTPTRWETVRWRSCHVTHIFSRQGRQASKVFWGDSQVRCSSALWRLSFYFTQIGNVAFFLEKGTKDDHYDFLELYIQRWQQEHEQIMDDCSNLRRRTQSRTATKGEGLDPRSLASSPRTQKLDYPHFSREFQPYDWWDIEVFARTETVWWQSHHFSFAYRYIQTRTHYYFRYEGSEPEPPCVEGVHWRVLKNPVTVAPSQIAALENLLANRIDPNTCLPYTAVRIEADGSVHNNRPIQKRRPSHLVVYCECEDWESNTLSDKKYCSLPPEERGVIVRTKKPIGPKTRSPTTTPTASPTFTSEECNNCPAGKSRYLCRLFEVLHPDETPFCT